LLLNSVVRRILDSAEANDQFYDGTLNDLPWSFDVRDLANPAVDIERMLRLWRGGYLEVRRYDRHPHDRYCYLFRDGSGIGIASISENMGLQYFRWFFNMEHALDSLASSGAPAYVHRGVPTKNEIEGADIDGDELPEVLALSRAVAAAYVEGEDVVEAAADLALRLGSCARPRGG